MFRAFHRAPWSRAAAGLLPQSRPYALVMLGVALSLAACSHSAPEPNGEAGSRSTPQPESHALAHVSDLHSFSRPAEARVTHAVFDWELDFAKSALRGTVTWTLDRQPSAQSVVLDTKHLAIDSVRVGAGSKLRPTEFSTSGGSEVFGTPLTIPLGPNDDTVAVTYRTLPEGACLQWLSPSQTADRRQPFLFSQAQSINARAMMPCQDSPGVRFTYDATVRTPDGIRPIMAAEILDERTPDGRYRFRMEQPIPSYLVAIAAGDLAFQSMGPRTGIWAEPSVVERGAWEFADTEKMIHAAEALYGPYRWGRYDIAILPPSFPFGGMENPRLTFATPTVLAGDRSLTALVAHELAHSWSGNLVTNATWSDFWLNEGFTVYFERRIMEAVYGPRRAEMEAVLGRQDLAEEMEQLPAGDTVLHVNLTGRDPDDAFSNVPYEKGYLFLRLLDETYGRTAFDAFLLQWFETNAFESRTTEDFLRHLRQHLVRTEAEAERLQLHAWIHEPGLPSNAPVAKSDAFQICEADATNFAAGRKPAKSLAIATWTSHETLHFLRALDGRVDAQRMAELDQVFQFSQSGNSEVLMQWGLLSIQNSYEPGFAAVANLLLNQGRRKFLKPLYQELVKTPTGRERAQSLYSQARPTYHQIAVNTIDGIVGWKE